MAYSLNQKSKIKADFESGRLKKVDVSKKWRMSRETLNKMAREGSWLFQKNGQKLDVLIEKQATERIVEVETNKLIDYTTVHLKHIKDLSALSAVNKADLAKIAHDSRSFKKIDKNKVYNMINIQRYIESSVKTYDMIYKSQRLAMGIQDSDTPPVVNINIGDRKELKNISDDKLEIMASELN